MTIKNNLHEGRPWGAGTSVSLSLTTAPQLPGVPEAAAIKHQTGHSLS